MNNKSYIKCYPCDKNDSENCHLFPSDVSDYLKCQQVGPIGDYSNDLDAKTGDGCGNQDVYTFPEYIQNSLFNVSDYILPVLLLITIFIILFLTTNIVRRQFPELI